MLRSYRTARIASNVTYIASSGLHALGYAIGLGIGAWLYGAGRISIGTAYLIVSYIALLADPLENLRRQVQDLQHASASIARVGELFAQKPDVRDAPRAALPSGPLSVAFEDATFRYDEANLAFDGVSLRVEPGEIVGVLGRTGSGKSTLTRLLFRLYDLQGGVIRVGGLDIRDVGLADLRDRIALVTQDVQIFEATIRDNLALFSPRIGDAQIENALRALGLWEWVEARQGGLEGGGLQSRLALGGLGLSAGEGQLLAFARAFLKNPGLVVLDEASSRLDPGTEQLLDQAVGRLLRGRTGIIIAHRLRTVQRADSIVIFENGRIVEYGRREVLARDPQSRFYRLLQVGLDEALAADTAQEEVEDEHVAV
ncbi:MAG: ABC transporter ATP-binding protein/permease [Chloroflexi bacterium]|nr:ABC transporter ATP-binding protein/permease [Chloroflexota bacterium]